MLRTTSFFVILDTIDNEVKIIAAIGLEVFSTCLKLKILQAIDMEAILYP